MGRPSRWLGVPAFTRIVIRCCRARVASRQDEADRLLREVEAELAQSLGVRTTPATDGDLARVESLRRTAADADGRVRGHPEWGFRRHISRIVVDTWSWHAPLSDALIAFDDRFLLQCTPR